jgi:hypothetical protein
MSPTRPEPPVLERILADQRNRVSIPALVQGGQS